ncbi:hypothetical protein I3760_03G027000 [Carya illinoinensis]|nr:hypothetical protein I3760_03G027000 [Carya illinoinensis]
MDDRDQKERAQNTLNPPCLSFKARPNSNHHVFSVPSPSPSLFPHHASFCPQPPHQLQSIIISSSKLEEKEEKESEIGNMNTCLQKK